MDEESPRDSIESSEADRSALIITSCLLGGLMAFLVFAGNFVFGSKPGNWSYEYLKKANDAPLWVPVVVLLLLGVSIFLGSKAIHIHEKATLMLCFVAVVVVQVLIRDMSARPLGSIVESRDANGFYTVAVRYSPAELLGRFEALVPYFPQHAQTNMPGKVLLYQFLGLFTASAQLMGYAVVLLSAAGAWLLYRICDQLFHSRQAAFYAFILYALVPCRLFFLPLLNSVTPVFMLLCLHAFVAYLQTGHARLLWLLGGALFLLILFEPSPMVTGILFVGILLQAKKKENFMKRELPALISYPVLGMLGLYLLLRLLFSFDLVHVFRMVLQDAVDFNFRAARGYRLWLGENAKEFFYGAGAPVMIIFAYVAARTAANWRQFARGARSWSAEGTFALSLLGTFCAVLFSGINRGEVSRLWIYLAVLFQIPAAVFISKAPKSAWHFFLVASTLAAQSMVALQRIRFL